MRAHQVRSYGPGVSENDHRDCLPQYEIRVTGHLGARWAAWFDGLDLITEDDGTTVLRGPVVDQAALHGLLQKLRDLGIPLVSLRELATDAPTDLPSQPTEHNPSGATS
jgi:hypothetical protein